MLSKDIFGNFSTLMPKFIDEVDPFIGVNGPGECLCGPYLPHSLVRLEPDTLPPHKTSGYASDSPIIRYPTLT